MNVVDACAKSFDTSSKGLDGKVIDIDKMSQHLSLKLKE